MSLQLKEQVLREQHLEVSFVGDMSKLLSEYEGALKELNIQALPFSVGVALKQKIRRDAVAVRGVPQSKYLYESSEKLSLLGRSPSSLALDLGLNIRELLGVSSSADEIISMVVGIEENLLVTRNLLRTWTQAQCKKLGINQSYRNSGLKMYFSLTPGRESFKSLAAFETEKGFEASSQKLSDLTDLFFKWWLQFCKFSDVESELSE